MPNGTYSCMVDYFSMFVKTTTTLRLMSVQQKENSSPNHQRISTLDKIYN